MHRTNDYGSFSGSFTAPRDRLTGNDEHPRGGTAAGRDQLQRRGIQAAEVPGDLDAPKTAAKLAAKVELTGKATAYTGAAVGGAKVRYRVVRQVRYPDWWGWCFWWRHARNGRARKLPTARRRRPPTAASRSSSSPSPTSPSQEKDEPIFEFSVSADVTDTSGETRSAQRIVNVGYTALRASLSAAEWLADQKPFEISSPPRRSTARARRPKGR